jgi:hypothetical protein
MSRAYRDYLRDILTAVDDALSFVALIDFKDF